uniref:Gypsy retrotransposon integrase-like protein 1 n=1 Tax=Pygocentrus nattereri TaxID=42514 RepID=A0AAR2M6Q9_PYGNA
MLSLLIRKFVHSGEWPADVTKLHPDVALMKRQSSKLMEKGGLVYSVTQKNSDGEIHQLLLPEKFREQVIKSVHDDMGHLGVERTLELVRNRFYWPRMSLTVELYVKNCGSCVAWKSPCIRAAPLHQIVTSGPMELVCIDFLCLEPDSKGFSNILVVTDHFSRYSQAYPTKDQRAVTVAKTLVEKFFVHYGLPSRIHSDQGRDFESRLIHELLRVLGIRKSRTTPYHPQGDPQPERFNRTLLSMLGTLGSTQKRQWSQHVSQLVHAYNSTKNDSTGYSPYFLMFGREARLPVDVCFGAEEREGVSHHRYVEELRQDLQNAYELAAKAASRVHLRNKRGYEKLLRPQVLDTGDRVLLKNLGLKGKHKLQSRWSSLPYVIVGKIPDLPVYRIKPESGMGRVRTIHRDHLLPIGFRRSSVSSILCQPSHTERRGSEPFVNPGRLNLQQPKQLPAGSEPRA